MLRLAGLPFVVEPEPALDRQDRETLASLAGSAVASAGPCGPPFRLELVDHPPWADLDLDAHADGNPAEVEAHAGGIRVVHHRFAAQLDPARRSGRLYRTAGSRVGLDVALRVALCTILPCEGALPLHAAGVVARGRGLAFFGPSGAGKSTVASACPWPVVSDELIAVRPAPPQLVATGFWGTHESAGARATQAPLAALIELGRGPRFALEPLEPSAALRRLCGVMVIPAEAALWRDALAVASSLVRAVPAYRLTWSPAEPPWSSIAARLGLAEGAS
jgi:hypothetical protein